MRIVVQRVDRAQVSVNKSTISSINKGVMVFLGVEKGDEQKEADYLLEKVLNLRIFDDTDGKMNLSLMDVAGEMLVVSQFTLLGDGRKGRRPSYIRAEEPNRAKELYEYFLCQARNKINRVSGGEFQAMMKVEIVNDGPVTMLLDSGKVF
jgi:D-tyrosyl-tRNA(Tyr) deacylase